MTHWIWRQKKLYDDLFNSFYVYYLYFNALWRFFMQYFTWKPSSNDQRQIVYIRNVFRFMDSTEQIVIELFVVDPICHRPLWNWRLVWKIDIFVYVKDKKQWLWFILHSFDKKKVFMLLNALNVQILNIIFPCFWDFVG